MEDKRYYWIKLKRDFFKRHDIRIVEGMPNGKDYILFYLKMLVESVDHDGNLRFSDMIPYNEDMLATITNTNVDIVRSAMKVFTELGMMEVLDDGTIFMNEVSHMIGSASNSDNAKRQKRFRDKKKQEQLESTVTKSNATVTQGVTNNNESIELEKEKDIEKDKEIDGDIKKKKNRFIPPTIDEVRAYCEERGNNIDPERFYNYYERNGWMAGRVKMKDWKAAIRYWEGNDKKANSGASKGNAFTDLLNSMEDEDE